MNSFKKFIKVGILFTVLLGVGVGVYYFRAPTAGIYSFNDSRDSEFLHRVFQKNWYWLVCDKKHVYNGPYVDYFIENKTTRSNPHQYGKNKMKVYFVDGKPAGFTSFFKKNSCVGKFLFLAVLEEFRGKGVGRKLLNYATDELFKDGCFKVELIVRNENESAIKLYESEGFEKYEEDDMASSFRKFRKKSK